MINNTKSSDDMSPQEMAADLTRLKNDLDDKMRLFNGAKEKVNGQMVESQNKAISSLFEIMQSNGVNLEDQSSVNAFLVKLQQVNPEGYQIFESAVDNLLSQKGNLGKMQPPAGFKEPLNPMDQLGRKPGSPSGAMNEVSQVPEGAVGPNAQPLPTPATPPPTQ